MRTLTILISESKKLYKTVNFAFRFRRKFSRFENPFGETVFVINERFEKIISATKILYIAINYIKKRLGGTVKPIFENATIE